MRRDRDGEILDEVDFDHDAECRDGWLGSEDAPRPCPMCRPWLTHRSGSWSVNRDAVSTAKQSRGAA